ncbi:hypothetical protein B484DRAFT_437842, partial [Ochromonadaceae sp. CCMP2298]
CPIIESNLHKWDKLHTIKQARVFKKEDYVKLYALPITPTHALWHAFAAVGTAIAGRSCEISNLCFKDVKRVVDEDGILAYHIEFDRAKKQTSNTSSAPWALLL